MCEPTTIALMALASSAGGTVMNSMAADDAASQKQNLINQGEEENQRISQSGEDRVNDFATETFGAKERDARYEEAATTREGSLVSALTAATGAATPQSAGGQVSSDYTSARTTSLADGLTQAQKQAKLLARSGASSLMYGGESMMGGQLASDLAGVTQRARRNNQFTQNGVGRVGDGGSLAGGLLQGIGAGAGALAGGRSGGGSGYPDSLPTRGGR